MLKNINSDQKKECQINLQATNYTKTAFSIDDNDVFTVKNNPKKDLLLSLCFDTEYKTTNLYNSQHPERIYDSRFGVTSQFKNNKNGNEYIFIHQHFAHYLKQQGLAKKIRHTEAESDFHVVDYLKKEGYQVKLDRREVIYKHHDSPTAMNLLEKLPSLTIELWGFYIIVDITMICLGDCREDLNRAFANKEIVQKRRLKASSKNSLWSTPWVIYINEKIYKINIKFYDACAVIGNASYKNFCNNVGVLLPNKDLPANYITRMDQAYLEIPEKFDAYALGDLKVYEANLNFSDLTKQVYDDLNIPEYYKQPKMTIGSTVEQIILSVILKKSKISAKDWQEMPDKQTAELSKKGLLSKEKCLENLTTTASANYLSKQITNNANLLSKCDGGRCWNAKPTVANQEGILVDIDISGAYSTSMSVLKFSLGKPIYISSKKGVKLSKFLNYYGKELLPGLYTMRVETIKNLKYKQDLIPSWFGCNSTITRKQDSEGWRITGELDLNSGETKIFSEQIINGTITSDVLDFIQKEWSARQKEDFFENTVVLAAGFYPKSLQLNNVDELHKVISEHKLKPDFVTILEDTEIINSNDCHNWWAFGLGEQLIKPISDNRKKYPKEHPLNNLFKLIGNTIYGDSVSKYFSTANMIIASNITAKVRIVMYQIEKALNLQGSITDGHIFDVNRVLYPTNKDHLNRDKLAVLYTFNDKKLHKNKICQYKPLFDDKVTRHGDDLFIINGQIYNNNEAKEIFAKKAMEHVKSIFNKNELLKSDIFKLEVKKIIPKAAYHATADYLTQGFDGELDVKMRSYEAKVKEDGTLKTEHSAFNLVGGIIKTDELHYRTNSPALRIMKEILQNKNNCQLQKKFIKSVMIKPGEYSNRYGSLYKNSHLGPGDNNMKIGSPRYFSIAQFHFIDLKQYKNWKRIEGSLYLKYGLSFEIFFPGKDENTVNYQQMIIKVDEMIREGVNDPMKFLDPYNNFKRKINKNIINDMEAVKKMGALIKEKTKISDEYQLKEEEFYH